MQFAPPLFLPPGSENKYALSYRLITGQKLSARQRKTRQEINSRGEMKNFMPFASVPDYSYVYKKCYFP